MKALLYVSESKVSPGTRWGLFPLEAAEEIDEIEAGQQAEAVAPVVDFTDDADVVGEACRAAGIGDSGGVEDGNGEWYLLELMTC